MTHSINELLKGYSTFRKNYFESKENPLFQQLRTHGQSPKAIVIACSDSRVDPAFIFDSAPGDLFVVRNVANLVPPCELDHSHHGTSAALEFAVCGLNVPHIVVMGHSNCGGIRALVEGKEKPSSHNFIGQWMALAEPALQKMEETSRGKILSLEEKAECCALHALQASRNNLFTFPWIQERVKKGVLSIHCWFFNLEDGYIHSYHPDTETFSPLYTQALDTEANNKK